MNIIYVFIFIFFFFQAEDGIRDRTVTGVQTCAFRSFDHKQKISKICELIHEPFLLPHRGSKPYLWQDTVLQRPSGEVVLTMVDRSEERRVGKECRSRWLQCH